MDVVNIDGSESTLGMHYWLANWIVEEGGKHFHQFPSY